MQHDLPTFNNGCLTPSGLFTSLHCYRLFTSSYSSSVLFITFQHSLLNCYSFSDAAICSFLDSQTLMRLTFHFMQGRMKVQNEESRKCVILLPSWLILTEVTFGSSSYVMSPGETRGTARFDVLSGKLGLQLRIMFLVV